MTIDRGRRITFEELADLYNEVRSGYPEELVEDVITLSGIPAGGYILEVGCGPGNATVSFARRGYKLLAVELGQQLAAYAAENCRTFPGVKIVNSAFEDWPLEEDTFDLAIAADSFHWIPPEIGYSKVARALKRTGSAGFFWNVPLDPGTEWSMEIDNVYQVTAPGVDNPDRPTMTVEDLKGIILKNFENSGCFGPIAVKQYSWDVIQTSEQYLKLLRTYSGHRGINAVTRSTLYNKIRTVLEKFGGLVTRPGTTILFQAKVQK